MTTDPDLLAAPGALLGGKYRLDRQLGQGGMGAVFAAENLLLRAPVAIKVLRPEVAQREVYTRRFVQEAQAAAQVRHPNVVSVLDFGYDDATGLLYLVQEFLSGTDLKAHLRAHGPMEPRAAIETLLPVMRALAYAHSRGVVHRDIKPDNIFLCETPEGVVPKVIDFGIAKVFDAEGQSAQRTRTMVVMGTPQYMSPEQACGDRAVDHRTDIWALGVVLYHALTGRFPYEGTTANIILAKVIQGHPTPIETYWPTIPSDLGALVRAAVSPDLTQRFQTMDAFWDAARRCSVMTEASSASPSGAFGAVAGANPSVTPPSMYAPAQAPSSGALHVSPYASPPAPPVSSHETGPPRVTTVPPTLRARRTAVWAVGGAVLLVGVLGAVGVRVTNRATSETPVPAAARESAGVTSPAREPAVSPPVVQPLAAQPSPALTVARSSSTPSSADAGAVQQVVAPTVAPRSAPGTRATRTTRARSVVAAPTTGGLIVVPDLSAPHRTASVTDAGAPAGSVRRPNTIVR